MLYLPDLADPAECLIKCGVIQSDLGSQNGYARSSVPRQPTSGCINLVQVSCLAGLQVHLEQAPCEQARVPAMSAPAHGAAQTAAAWVPCLLGAAHLPSPCLCPHGQRCSVGQCPAAERRGKVRATGMEAGHLKSEQDSLRLGPQGAGVLRLANGNLKWALRVKQKHQGLEGEN